MQSNNHLNMIPPTISNQMNINMPYIKQTYSNTYNNSDLNINPQDQDLFSDEKRENLIKLFVGGLNYVSLQSDIKSYFETFGKVLECTLMIDKPSGKSRGYAFITIEDTVGKARQRIVNRKHEINGKIVDVKFAVEGKEKEEMMDSKKKIFVGGLDPTVNNDDLREYFSEFGDVKEAVVLFNSDRGVSRCFGFVTFEDKETVEKLVRDQNFSIKGKQIEVKPAVPKSQQKAMNVVSQSGVDYVLNQNKKISFKKSKNSEYWPDEDEFTNCTI